MELIKYENKELKEKINHHKQGNGIMKMIADSGEELMQTNDYEFLKIEFILNKKIDWSESSYKIICSEDYNKLYCGHWNSYDYSLGDVLESMPNPNLKDEELNDFYNNIEKTRKEKEKHNRIEKYKGWAIEINRSAYDTRTFNIKLFNGKMDLIEEEMYDDGVSIVKEYIDYIDEDGNDLINVINNNENIIILFSIKENKYFGCLFKNNIGYFVHGYNLKDILENIGNQLKYI